MRADSHVQTPTQGGAAHKALSIIMALVLALGLMPISHGQAWAGEFKAMDVNGPSVTTASTGSGSYELIGYKGTSKTPWSFTYDDCDVLATGDGTVDVSDYDYLVLCASDGTITSASWSPSLSNGSDWVTTASWMSSDLQSHGAYGYLQSASTEAADGLTLNIAMEGGTQRDESYITLGYGNGQYTSAASKTIEAGETTTIAANVQNFTLSGTDVAVGGADKGVFKSQDDCDKFTINWYKDSVESAAVATQTLKWYDGSAYGHASNPVWIGSNGFEYSTNLYEAAPGTHTFYAVATYKDGDTVVTSEPLQFDVIVQGASAAEYAITASVSPAAGGSVTVANGVGESITTAKEGDTVSVYGDKKAGYTFGSIEAKDASGNKIETEQDEDDWYNDYSYTFTMPASAVTVTVTFTGGDEPEPTTYGITNGTTDANIESVSFRIGEDQNSAEGTQAAAGQKVYVNPISDYDWDIKVTWTDDPTKTVTVHDAETTWGHKYFEMPAAPVTVTVTSKEDEPSGEQYDYYVEFDQSGVTLDSEDGKFELDEPFKIAITGGDYVFDEINFNPDYNDDVSYRLSNDGKTATITVGADWNDNSNRNDSLTVEPTFKKVYGISYDLGEGVNEYMKNLNKVNAEAGSAVTVATSRNDFHYIDSVTITRDDGVAVASEDQPVQQEYPNETHWKFKMQEGAVTVHVTAKQRDCGIVVDDSIEGGKVVASANSFKLDEGSTFTLTAIPDKGYKLQDYDGYSEGLLVLDERDGYPMTEEDYSGFLSSEWSEDGLSATYTVDGYYGDTYKTGHEFTWNPTVFATATFEEKEEQTITLGTSSISQEYAENAAAIELNAVASDSGALTYATSNDEVATVSADGKVSIVGAGDATITVTAAETADCKEAVAEVPVSIAEAENTFTISAKALAARPYSADGYTVAAADLYARSDDAADDKAEVVFLKKSGNKQILVDVEDGSLVVPAGLAVGTYPVRVVAMASGGQNMKAKATNVDLTLKVVQAASPLAIESGEQSITYGESGSFALSASMDGATFEKVSGPDQITVDADGAVAYASGLTVAGGPYELVVRAKTPESVEYAAGDVTKTVKVTVAPASIKGAKLVLKDAYVIYNKSKVQKPVVATVGGKALAAGDYTLTVKQGKTTVASPKAVGTYTVTVAGKGNYTGTSGSATYKILNKNTLAAKAANATVAFAKVSKAAQSAVVGNVSAVGQGKLTVTNVSTDATAKKWKVAYNAKTKKITVTVPKSTKKKNAYAVKVKVATAGNTTYAPGAVTLTSKVVVK